MYNLENLQINHPRLKRLNNWTENPNDEEFETSKSYTNNLLTLGSQNNAAERLEKRIEREDSVVGLLRKTLPPISQKRLTEASLSEEKKLEDNGRTFFKTSSGVLPPIDKVS